VGLVQFQVENAHTRPVLLHLDSVADADRPRAHVLADGQRHDNDGSALKSLNVAMQRRRVSNAPTGTMFKVHETRRGGEGPSDDDEDDDVVGSGGRGGEGRRRRGREEWWGGPSARRCGNRGGAFGSHPAEP